jgi:hypothetical protein
MARAAEQSHQADVFTEAHGYITNPRNAQQYVDDGKVVATYRQTHPAGRPPPEIIDRMHRMALYDQYRATANSGGR